MFDQNYVKECFKNHKATIKFYDNITVLDFKNPNSNEYRIRFLFENDYYRLHISGDIGELTATNFGNMTYERFDDFVRDVGYFRTKINCCSRPPYLWDRKIGRISTDIFEVYMTAFKMAQEQLAKKNEE